ncbi:MAG TPA: hypothetical protein VJK72_01095 [Candidatus Nanoarchaeia archaeon]|nr:hypothetical protein [Candidatus Nanoarchaeia archaeon]
MDYQRGSFRKHEQIKQQILRDPSLIGIEGRVIYAETEHALIKRKRPIAKPDIMFEYMLGSRVRRVYVEVKSGSCRRSVRNLEMQLRKVRRFLDNKRMNGDVLGVYCTGDLMNVITI